jgi:hypothetical protein
LCGVPHHASTTDKDPSYVAKAQRCESKAASVGQILLDNRHELVANICAKGATGTAERNAAVPPRNAISSRN